MNFKAPVENAVRAPHAYLFWYGHEKVYFDWGRLSACAFPVLSQIFKKKYEEEILSWKIKTTWPKMNQQESIGNV